jgi:adenylate cyclase
LGDVLIDGTDLLGEGVNLAARLQTMAEPGGILISQHVYDQVHGKLSVGFDYLGQRRPKNFTEDVTVYRIELDGKRRPARKRTVQPPHSADDGRRSTEDTRARVIRHGKALGVVWAALVIIDLFTGSPFWAHWPGIVIAALWALEATPLFIDSWFWRLYARAAVLVGALAVINIFTWADYPWVLWPAGILAVTALIHRVIRPPS